MTLSHAATKSCTNFSCASSAAYTSAIARSCEFDAEDQVDRAGRPLQLAGGAVEALVHVLARLGHLPLRAHVQQVDEEVVGQDLGPIGEHTVLRAAVVGAERAQAADEHRHLRRGQVEHVRAVDQPRLRRQLVTGPQVVAETVGNRLQHRERLDVGLLLRGVGAPGGERHRDLDAGVARRLLDRRTAAEHDHVGQRDPHRPLCAALNSCWIRSSAGSTRGQLLGFVRPPSRAAAPAGSARRWRHRACPCRGSSPPPPRPSTRAAAMDRPRVEDRRLQRRDLRSADQLVLDRRHRVLPQLRLGDPRAEVAAQPGPCRGAAACTRPWRRPARTRPGAPGSGGRSSRRPGRTAAPGRWSASSAARRGESSAGRGWCRAGAVLGLPLPRAGGALGQLPLEAEQVLQELVRPLRRGLRPGDLEATGDRVGALAGAVPVASSRGPAPPAARPPAPGRRARRRPRRRASCRSCGRRRSARRSPRRSSPSARTSRGCRAPPAAGRARRWAPPG